MRIQLWSYNYSPEPTGIAPISSAWAESMSARGHEVRVVAAHPHYPDPVWGRRILPYREVRSGIPVVRMPIWPGRGSVAERARQELSFLAPLTLALPALPAPDVLVATSPSFPALAPAMLFARAHRIPWTLWLQDILPDGATATGLLGEGRLVRSARRFEKAAYRSAAKVVVISDSFTENLRAKGVPSSRIQRIYNPATRPIRDDLRPVGGLDKGLVLTMGNIGHTQNLTAVTQAFEANERLAQLNARFVMAGDGVAGPEVRAAITTTRVEVTGVLNDYDDLEPFLMSATVGLISQAYDGVDFNVPSKLMNFLGYGIPVVAAVRRDSEVARLVERYGVGWIADSPAHCAELLADALSDPAECRTRSKNCLSFAKQELSPERVADQFDQVLSQLVPAGESGPSSK